VHVLPRDDAIKHQVHENLLQLDAIPHHSWEVCGEFGPDGNDVSHCLAVQQRDNFSDEVVPP
jgi:hypothetical protein